MKRRVVAGLGAFILMAALVAFPLRARAMSAAAVAASVGGATLIAAYMAACGIYPYSEDGQSFGEWGARALTDLVEQYNQNRLERQIQIAQLTGYVAGRTIAIARDTWDTLREFVGWCRETFSLEDNQTGVNVGIVSSDGFLPYNTDWPVGSDTAVNASSVVSLGFLFGTYTWGTQYFAAATIPNVILAARQSGRNWSYIGISDSSFYSVYLGTRASNYANCLGKYRDSYSFNGKTVYITGPVLTFTDLIPSELVIILPDFSAESVVNAYYGGGVDTSLQGITVDTSTVSIPAELPEDDDTEWVGLSVYPGTVTGVAGTGTTTETGVETGTGAVAGTENPATVLTPQAVERIIQQGVEERQRPDVRPVEVEIGEGVTVDEETGELVAAEPGTVVITETDIPLSLGDYAIPSLSTVFPFSIPWDIMRVWQALDAEPRFPLQDFSMTLSVPWLFGDSPPTVRFGLDAFGPGVAQKMDELAFMVRSFLLVIACVGFLIFISQFIKF